MAGCSSFAARSASASGKAAASRKLKALRACSSTNMQRSIVDPGEVPGGAVVGQATKRAVGQLDVPLVLEPGLLAPPLARGAPRTDAGHDASAETARAQGHGTARGERARGGSRRTEPAQGEGAGGPPPPPLSPDFPFGRGG